MCAKLQTTPPARQSRSYSVFSKPVSALILAAAILLTAAGIFLLAEVAGGLAVLSGIGLILAGLVMGVFWLYALIYNPQ